MIEDYRQTARESIFIWSNLSNDLMELIPSGQMAFTWTLKDPSFKVLQEREVVHMLEDAGNKEH